MNLQTIYKQELKTQLRRELGIKNPMAVPRVEKVVIDVGIGQAAGSQELISETERDLALITGQKPQLRGARRAIAGFGLRVGDSVGFRTTLRGQRMYTFLEKLFSIVLPRLRDLRGTSLSSFDGRGNYTLGLPEHTIFPEIDVSGVKKTFGLGITIVTSTGTDDYARLLLEKLGMPFEKRG